MARLAEHDVVECARAWRLLRLAHDRVAGRLSTELGHACGLTISEFDVLLYLRSSLAEGARLSVLQAATPLSQPALSRLVARLVERGILSRREAEDDGRAAIVRLTENGAQLADKAIAIHSRIVHETLTGKFSEQEREVLLETLRQIG